MNLKSLSDLIVINKINNKKKNVEARYERVCIIYYNIYYYYIIILYILYIIYYIIIEY